MRLRVYLALAIVLGIGLAAVLLQTTPLQRPAAEPATVTLVNPDGTPVGAPWQTWADESLAPSPPGEVTFTAGPGPCGNPGCSVWGNGPDAKGEVWVRPEARDARHLLLHELGHIFDGRVMNDKGRADWKHAVQDRRTGPWVTPQPESQSALCSLSCEWLAEGYAMCADHGPHIAEPVRGVYGYTVGPKRHRRACRVLRKAAKGLYAGEQAQASTPPTTEAPRPLVLLAPPGGFQHADPATMKPWVDDFARHGSEARAISYPLRTVVGAIEYVAKIAANETRPVICYGISAGGTICAGAAATGAVEGAVDIAGPVDFTRWLSPFGLKIMRDIGMTGYAQKRAASPYWRLNGQQAPQLLQYGTADPLVEFTQGERYKSAASRGNPDTTLMRLLNGHGQGPGDRDRAREWIVARWPP